MTRDLFPYVVMDKTFDAIRTRAIEKLEEPNAAKVTAIVDWCAVVKAEFISDMNTIDRGSCKRRLQELYDAGIPIDDACATFALVLAQALRKIGAL